jgi:ABC-type bacteriocin/lantibiotic exporter with double-glycine peptidase domain
MAFSTQSTWNALNSGLIQMAGSIQHNFTQDLEQLQNINQEWQNFSGQVESFDDVLNQQQLVEDPTTGTYYEAPYSSYETDGPDGAGYYTSNGEPLSPVAGG